jgi:hypothetical protein
MPTTRRRVADLRLKHLPHLPRIRILAGDLRAPAATVAGDRLRRRGAACIWPGLALERQQAHAVYTYRTPSPGSLAATADAVVAETREVARLDRAGTRLPSGAGG